MANESQAEHSSALRQPSSGYQNTSPLMHGVLRRSQKAHLPPAAGNPAGRGSHLVELAPASHAIHETTKKLVMFRKSQVLQGMLARVLLGQLQAGP